jgi:hypothetical protein
LIRWMGLFENWVPKNLTWGTWWWTISFWGTLFQTDPYDDEHSGILFGKMEIRPATQIPEFHLWQHADQDQHLWHTIFGGMNINLYTSYYNRDGYQQ